MPKIRSSLDSLEVLDPSAHPWYPQLAAAGRVAPDGFHHSHPAVFIPACSTHCSGYSLLAAVPLLIDDRGKEADRRLQYAGYFSDEANKTHQMKRNVQLTQPFNKL